MTNSNLFLYYKNWLLILLISISQYSLLVSGKPDANTSQVVPEKESLPIISRHLMLDENYSISWTIVDSTNEIVFKGLVRTRGYIGLGISLNGAMNGADIVIIRKGNDRKFILEDRHGVGNVEPILDNSQDWKLLASAQNETHIKFEVSRLLNTGDSVGDIEITVDTLRLIWAYGMDDINSQNVYYHGPINRGVKSVNFMDTAVETPSAEDMAKLYPVWKTQKRVQVAPNDTVYMCSFYKAPNLTKKHHMVGFGMHIDRPESTRHIHHADLYRCTAPPGVDPDEFFAPYMNDVYDCNYSPTPFPYDNCGLFEFQWTIGGVITLFPDNLGMPIGNPDGSPEYYMTEVHYDNPTRRSDLDITAGFNIYYTPELRETEVGHLQLGVMTNKTYSLTVPPNSTDFIVSSHCPKECTSSIPVHGINIFTFLLHSHLSGRKLKLRHFRNEIELPVLAKDDNFDFRYQNNRRLRSPVKILPGDHLTIECTYDNTWKGGKVALGGRAARDEMCQAFLLYYPRMHDINSCGSYNQQHKILEYMGINSVSQYQGEIDATIISPEIYSGLKYSHVVENQINWTNERRMEYQGMVRYRGQQAYCSPIHYYNASFVITNYPQVAVSNPSPDSPYSTLFLCVALGITVTLIVSLIALALFAGYRIKMRNIALNSTIGVVSPTKANKL